MYVCMYVYSVDIIFFVYDKVYVEVVYMLYVENVTT